MKKAIATALLLLCGCSSAFGATRYTFRQPIPSDVRQGDYLCQNAEDLQTIYAVTMLFAQDHVTGRKVAQKFVDMGLCRILQASGVKAMVTDIEVTDDPSGVSEGYYFALATFTLDGKAIQAWSHIRAFPELKRRDAELYELIRRRPISGQPGYILENASGSRM